MHDYHQKSVKIKTFLIEKLLLCSEWPLLPTWICTTGRCIALLWLPKRALLSRPCIQWKWLQSFHFCSHGDSLSRREAPKRKPRFSPTLCKVHQTNWRKMDKSTSVCEGTAMKEMCWLDLSRHDWCIDRWLTALGGGRKSNKTVDFFTRISIKKMSLLKSWSMIHCLVKNCAQKTPWALRGALIRKDASKKVIYGYLRLVCLEARKVALGKFENEIGLKTVPPDWHLSLIEVMKLFWCQTYCLRYY